MKSGEQTMDAGFQLTIPDVTGGKTGGGVVPGPGHTLYTRVLDESLYPVSSATSSTVLLSQPAWRWWQIDLDAPSVATQSTASPGTGEVKFFVANGTAYAGSSADSHYSTSVVEDLRDAAQPTDGTLVNGFLSGVVKVSSR